VVVLSGRLFIIATPIGNLKDVTIRAREALSEADFVLAEDTRVTIKLLNHLGLKKKLISCHDYNEVRRLSLLEQAVREDKTVALVSDAGTPLVSDPGYQIVRSAIELGMQTIPVPGASALLLALVASGLACERFVFEGFPPQRKGDRLNRLAQLASEERTMIFYVGPHDLPRFLDEILKTLGDRPACLAREITKLHEEFIRGSVSAIGSGLANRKVLGECVLVLSGAQAAVQAEEVATDQIIDELRGLVAAGMRLSHASAQVARRHGLPRSQVYKLGLKLSQGN
jgi:16S rRNA (cytidine1402-2'-O)-methyltransferase